AASEDRVAVGRESHAPHRLGMADKPSRFVARFYIPQPGRFVTAGGQDRASIGRKRDVPHRAAMPDKAFQFLASFNLPQSGCAIDTACQDDFVIRRVGDAEYRLSVACEDTRLNQKRLTLCSRTHRSLDVEQAIDLFLDLR